MQKALKVLFILSFIALIISCIALFKAYHNDQLPIGTSFSPMTSFSAFSTTAVGTSSVKILSLDPARSYALFTNDSDTAIYLNLSSASTTLDNFAVRLNANGGSYEISANRDNLYSGEVWASSTAASKSLRTLVK